MDAQLLCRLSYATAALMESFLDKPTLRCRRKASQIPHCLRRGKFRLLAISVAVSCRGCRRKYELIVTADYKDSLHYISKFPDVARPAVVQHGLHGYRRKSFVCVVFFVEHVQEIFRQRNDVFFSFPQRWQLNYENA